MINYTVEIFNSFDLDLQFTVEIEKENKISFLNLLIIKNERNNIITDWFRKPTNTGRYLNFNSHHTKSVMIGNIYSLVDKSITLSHKKFHRKNIKLIKEILINNEYPKNL